MIIRVDKSGTVEGFNKIIGETAAEQDIKGILILACDSNNFTPQAVDEILNNVGFPLFGGIFPEIIFNKEKFTAGTIVAGLKFEPKVQVVSNLSDITAEYDDILDEKIPDIGLAKTMFVLVDGLSTRINALIDSLFNVFGLEVNYIGGGAGSLSFEQKPCLFTNGGLIQDSALLALLDMESGIGVNHGWTSISGPFKVTESDSNVIKGLDWQPAFEVYKKVVEGVSGKIFTNDNFFELAKGYPFGINKLGAEKIVRDPIMIRDDGGLVCVGEIPEESHVDILSGNVTSLVNAAAKALALGTEAIATQPTAQTTFFIDCISRVLFLEDQFELELAAVARDGIPMIGALTLGEIANNGKDYLEFYNKPAVIGVLEG